MSKLYVIEVVQTKEDGGTIVRTSWMSDGNALVVYADSPREAFEEALKTASPEIRTIIAGWNETGEWSLRPREATILCPRMDIKRVFDELDVAQAKAEADWEDRNYADDERPDNGWASGLREMSKHAPDGERDQLDYVWNNEPPCSQY